MIEFIFIVDDKEMAPIYGSFLWTGLQRLGYNLKKNGKTPKMIVVASQKKCKTIFCKCKSWYYNTEINTKLHYKTHTHLEYEKEERVKNGDNAGKL